MMEHFDKPRARLLCRFCFLGVWALTLAQTAFAQDSNSEGQSRAFGGPDAPANRIESDSSSTDTPFKLDSLQSWYDWKDELHKEHGLSLGVEYNVAYLTADERLSGADDHASGGIFRFSGVWEAYARGSANPGNLVFLVEHTDEFTDTGPSSFLGESLGYAGISNLPYNDEGWRLNTLYWDQKFQHGKYEFVAGWLDTSDYVDVFPLVSPWTDFFNYSFSIGVGALDLSSDPALGFAGAAWLTDSVYTIAGFADQNADGTDPLEGFDTFTDEKEYFKHIEIGWTGASQEAYYLNNVHLTLWQADERDDLGVEDGWGGVLSFNHTIGDKWLGFVRAGYSDDGGSLLERSFSIGGGYLPGGIASLGSGSQLGFAANWGSPNDALFGANLDDQYALEAYYRLQLSRELAITPSVQWLRDPALNPDEDSIWVAGLRARFAF